MRTAAFVHRIVQFTVDVPAVILEINAKPIMGEVPISPAGIGVCNYPCLIVRNQCSFSMIRNRSEILAITIPHHPSSRSTNFVSILRSGTSHSKVTNTYRPMESQRLTNARGIAAT